jgi:hypothetical protein
MGNWMNDSFPRQRGTIVAGQFGVGGCLGAGGCFQSHNPKTIKNKPTPAAAAILDESPPEAAI